MASSMTDRTKEEQIDAAVPGQNAGPMAPTGAEVIQNVLKTLPQRPGVYRMLNAEGDVLYVGKARNLRKRVAAYTKMGGHTNRIARMISLTRSMEVVTTGSETEALLLEANLIKRLKPRYNVLLRDDKSFPYILATGDHAFPQIVKHRGARNKPGDYFGPFASAGAVNRTLNTLQRAFLLRSCSDSVFESRSRPCLLYQIKRCSAPCVDYVSQEEYGRLLDDAKGFLKGKSRRVKEQLSGLMNDAADAMDYEKAAVYRDRIRALSHVQLHQDINPSTIDEADVVAAHEEGSQVCIQVFFFRSGQNWGNRAYYPRHDRGQHVHEVLGAFLAQFYDNKPVPRMVLLSHSVPDQKLLEEALSTRADRRVRVLVPQRGEKKDLVDHAARNAEAALARRMAESASERKMLDALCDAFDLESPPTRIEVYDNSHIQGAHPVGAMIVRGPAGFEKNQYRKFNIKDDSLSPGDDYGMLREVLTRRFSRLLKEDQKSASDDAPREEADDAESPTGNGNGWPDLILIDGGAGQLGVAEEVFAELGIESVALVAIAKGPDRNAGRETFFMPGRPSFTMETRSPVLFYLQKLRDEAHRFAIGSHRARRSKAVSKSPLDEIPGVGGARKKALLLHFGSARGVERAGLSDLQDVEGISESLAQRIYDHFHSDD